MDDEVTLAKWLGSERGRAHSKGHATEFASQTLPSHAGMRPQVLEVLCDQQVNDDEGSAVKGWVERLDFGRRREELVAKGLARWTGECRPSWRGNPARVHEATSLGIRVLRRYKEMSA